MLGKPLTKETAKGGFEQNICFRRTGVKSNYKAQRLKTGNGGRAKDFGKSGETGISRQKSYFTQD